VTHGDLMPTLLDLVGVSAPSSVLTPGFAHLLSAKWAEEDGPARPIVSETWTDSEPDAPSSISVRLGSSKLLRYRKKGVEHLEVYDLSADPGEENDLAQTHERELRELTALIDTYGANAAALRRKLTEAPSGAKGEDVVLDPAREEMMRALGYIE